MNKALEDIDRAIAMNDDVPGDHYYQRFAVYGSCASAEGSAAIRLHLAPLSLENLRRELAMGTASPTAHRSLPLNLVTAGRCVEGLAEARRLIDAEESGDPRSASNRRAAYLSDLCLERYEQALRSIRALAITDEPAWSIELARNSNAGRSSSQRLTSRPLSESCLPTPTNSDCPGCCPASVPRRPGPSGRGVPGGIRKA